ncbi:MAG TPA: ABC transporter permease [Propionicimonas sp.]|uniref:ABC transporter permease n=1 Tax=Propionicimonas sp. TaxID=1955623 RepID=UPI002F40A9E0
MNAWRLSVNGLRTVTELELKQRIRSRRWIVALLVWFLVIGAITSLVILATSRLIGGENSDQNPGPMAFALNVFFVLGMGLIIAPTFTATSINGDRSAGTLATLQATRLSAAEIAIGKLLAAWLTALVFLVVGLPFIAWSMVSGSISLWQVVACFAVVFVLVAIVCAIGLGWSALLSRPAGSTVMTYLSVVALTVISTFVMAMMAPLVRTAEPVRVWGLPPAVAAQYQAEVDKYSAEHPDGDTAGLPQPPVKQCTWNEETTENVHMERVWWITVINPFVIVADAAPLPSEAYANLNKYASATADPLAMIRLGVRSLAQPPAAERDDCIWLYTQSGYNVEYGSDGTPHVTTASGATVNVETPVKRRPVAIESAIWPWGLGANLLIGATFLWVAVRRLKVPYGQLPPGTRVA